MLLKTREYRPLSDGPLSSLPSTQHHLPPQLRSHDSQYPTPSSTSITVPSAPQYSTSSLRAAFLPNSPPSSSCRVIKNSPAAALWSTLSQTRALLSSSWMANGIDYDAPIHHYACVFSDINIIRGPVHSSVSLLPSWLHAAHPRSSSTPLHHDRHRDPQPTAGTFLHRPSLGLHGMVNDITPCISSPPSILLILAQLELDQPLVHLELTDTSQDV